MVAIDPNADERVPVTPAFDAWSLTPGLSADPARPSDYVRGVRITPSDIRGWTERLEQYRLATLERWPLDDRIRALGTIGRRLGDPSDALHREALRHVPRTSGLSPEMSEVVLARMAGDWTESALRKTVTAEFPDPETLDAFRQTSEGRVERVLPLSPSIHIGAGTVPGVTLTSMLRALLVGAAVLVKPGRGDVVLPVLGHRALMEEAPELAGWAAVAYWRGDGKWVAEGAAGTRALVVYGSDDTVRSIRRSAPVAARLVEYPHRVSVALVGREALSSDRAAQTAEDVAGAISAYDSRGCVSPRCVVVETGADVGPERWCELLHAALLRRADAVAPGPLTIAAAARSRQWSDELELRIAAGEPLKLFGSAGPGWAIVLDQSDGALSAAPGRTVLVRRVDDLARAVELLRDWSPHLQTVGVAAAPDRHEGLAESLAQAGALRITGVSEMPWPAPGWLHDGRGPLTDLVIRVEREGTSDRGR